MKYLITFLILFGLFFYFFQPVPNCKPVDIVFGRDTIYSYAEAEKVFDLQTVHLNVIGNSMLPTILDNSECVCLKKESYQVDDIVLFFEKTNNKLKGIVHRIIQIDDEIHTKGDNNYYADESINLEDIVCSVPMVARWQTW